VTRDLRVGLLSLALILVSVAALYGMGIRGPWWAWGLWGAFCGLLAGSA
jgi:hypothetical protein